MPSLTAGKRRKHETSFLNNQLFFFLISAFTDFSQITDLWKIMDWNGLIWLYRGWSHLVDNGCKIYRLKFSQIQRMGSWSNQSFNNILPCSNTKKKHLWKNEKKYFSLAIFLLISYIIYIILIILIGNKNSVKTLIPKVKSHYFSSIRFPLALLYNLTY